MSNSSSTLLFAVLLIIGGCSSSGKSSTGAGGEAGTVAGGGNGGGGVAGTSGGGKSGNGGAPAAGGSAGGTAGAAGGGTGGSAGSAGGAVGCIPVTANFALAFDTSPHTQYVRIPDAPALHLVNAITLEAWVSVLDTGSDCIICKPVGTGTDDSFALWFQGPLYFGLNVPSPSGALNFAWSGGTSGAWHHVAATFENATGQQQLFIDGSLVKSQTNPQGSPTYDGNPLLIGADTDGGPTAFAVGFKGSIDEVRIFSAVRSAQQIAADMVGGCSPVNDPTLVAYYPFDEGAGTIVHDASPNHLDGTLGAPDAGAGMSPTWTSSTVPF
jgi:hypothetical protein